MASGREDYDPEKDHPFPPPIPWTDEEWTYMKSWAGKMLWYMSEGVQVERAWIGARQDMGPLPRLPHPCFIPTCRFRKEGEVGPVEPVKPSLQLKRKPQTDHKTIEEAQTVTSENKQGIENYTPKQNREIEATQNPKSNVSNVPLEKPRATPWYGCWNCGGTDHRHRVCREPKVEGGYCFGCGWLGVTMKQCPRCAEYWASKGRMSEQLLREQE